MWSHVRSTKSLTADDFFCEKRRRPRPRFFEHNNYILTTAVAKGRPPWRSIIWNESARDRPTWSAIFLCGTKMVPHASYYVHAGSEPEIALAPRSSSRSTTKKHKKHLDARASSTTAPHPIHSSPIQCPAPPAPWGVTPIVNKNDPPSAQDRVRQPVALPAPKQQKIPIKMQQPPATQQSTTIWLDGREEWQRAGRVSSASKLDILFVHLFRYNNVLPREDNYMGFSKIYVPQQSTKFTHLAWTKCWITKKSERNNE